MMERLASLQQKTSWLRGHIEMDRRMLVAILVIAISLSYALGYGNYMMDQNTIHAVSTQLGQEKTAVAKLSAHDLCMTNRAKIAAQVANDPNGDVSTIPRCPPPPQVKK